MDLTPRTAPAPEGLADGPDVRRAARGRGGKRRGLVMGVALVVLLGAAGFLLIKAMGDASLYYYNADKAVAQKSELGDKRFRIQGTYEGDKVDREDGSVLFDIVFNGVKVPVDHSGSQPALFRPGIPVVLEGRWSNDRTTFLSDRIEVKHSDTYTAQHPNRVETNSP